MAHLADHAAVDADDMDDRAQPGPQEVQIGVGLACLPTRIGEDRVVLDARLAQRQQQRRGVLTAAYAGDDAQAFTLRWDDKLVHGCHHV